MVLFILITTSIIKAVDHPNKRISENEKKRYTQKALFIELFYSIIILSFYRGKFIVYLNIALFTMIFCVLGILLTNVKKRVKMWMNKNGVIKC